MTHASSTQIIPSHAEKADTASSAAFPRARFSRNLSLSLLAISWITSITLIAFGAAYPSDLELDNIGFRTFSSSPALKEVLPLLVNIGVTILTESTGYIHSIALRWALGPQLTFNSNLRLFTRVPRRWAFGRLSNFFGAGFLVLSYAATSLIFATLPPRKICDELPVAGGGYDCDRKDIAYFRPGSLIALGIGLFGQNGLTTWQLLSVWRNNAIVTWSTSPIVTAWATSTTTATGVTGVTAATGQRLRVPGRCMRPVHDACDARAIPVAPLKKQRNAWAAHNEVKRVTLFIWTLVVLTFIWFICVIASLDVLRRRCESAGQSRAYLEFCENYFAGKDWSLLPDTGGGGGASGGVTALLKITLLNDGGGRAQGPVLGYAGGFAVVFVVVMAFQSVLTIGLHCAELIVTASRDEDLWRRASGSNGYKEVGALRTVLGSWKSIVLLVLKPVVHWLFGLAMTFYIGWGIFFRPPQILYLCLTVLIVAIFATYLCLHRPEGPQPATFGHVQTLLDLADEWSEHLFWGQKGEPVGSVWHAGTSDKRLEPVVLGRAYAGSEPLKNDVRHSNEDERGAKGR